MKWDEDAKKAHEILPVPPMMLPYARLQSEKIARHQGRDLVTVEVVKETEKIYGDLVGKEKTEEIKAFIQGTGPAPAIEEDLF
ncbi:MAG: PCP reductase family protein, partial [Deltaproteobacteria bacterium]|nr:PCP reductase family protein [Deltaproteobacteria bacterium]